MWKKRFLGISLTLLLMTPGLIARGLSHTDALGRTVDLPESPRRVAALLGSFAEVWQLSGGSLCAAPDDAWSDYGLELEDALCIGGAHSPSAELLLSAKPDLVLASAATTAHVELLSLLESAGIPVLYFQVNSFPEYLDMLGLCTRITGREDLYGINGLRQAERIDEVKKGLPHEMPSVLLLRASSGLIRVKGGRDTLLGNMLLDLGCKNIADSEGQTPEALSMEHILRCDPDHIFVALMGDDSRAAEESLKKMMEEDPAWGALTALREGRLHLMDRRLFSLKPNARWADAYEELAAILG